jgi:GNAT superfamily N-acetyltransferase
VIRRLAPADSLADLTALLNRAYKQLLDMGLRYVATWQDEEITRKRIEGAECWVAESDGRIVGTIALYPPGGGKGHPFYERDDVAKIGQFGIEPELQGTGLGSRLMEHVERRARELGAIELAGDTAEPAQHLHAFYARRGYRVVGRIRHDVVNYPSVIRSKAL